MKTYYNAYYSIELPYNKAAELLKGYKKDRQVELLTDALDFDRTGDGYMSLKEATKNENLVNEARLFSASSGKYLEVKFSRLEEWEELDNGVLTTEYCYSIADDTRLSALIDDISGLLFD